VYSSQGSQDSPVYIFITGDSRLPGVFTTGELRFARVFITGESFWTPQSHFTVLRSIQQSLKGLSFKKSSVGCFNSLGTCDLCLQKLPNRKDSYRLPGVLIAAESITNTNNFTNIRKNSKIFPGMSIGTRRSCLMKKTGHEKSCDTVLLKFIKSNAVSFGKNARIAHSPTLSPLC
jgi:hypothetical protein